MVKGKKTLERFLEFGGKKISILNADGTWYVAIKPICEALNVDYERQRERISRHNILSQLPTKQGVVAADGKLREMICLPEKYIYGWLFSINSDSEDLINYQKECYEILYNHFHGMLNERYKRLQMIDDANSEIEQLEEALLNSNEYIRIQELKKEKKHATAGLKILDKHLVNGQGSFF